MPNLSRLLYAASFNTRLPSARAWRNWDLMNGRLGQTVFPNAAKCGSTLDNFLPKNVIVSRCDAVQYSCVEVGV